MSEPIKLVDLVDQRLHAFIESRADELAVISPDLDHIIEHTRGLLGTGKRFRARFCYWGWKSAGASNSDIDIASDVERVEDIDSPLALAMSLEVFHAAALVHDDIMDNSDTRRGKPSAHKSFGALHQDRQYSGDSHHFGESTALLVGDLLLAWSDDLLNSALSQETSREVIRATRSEFSRMRQEVTVGQYLDIHEEAAWLHSLESERLERALRVVTYKSAKYSMEAPLLIGASLAGATAEELDSLRAFGLPLGIAFQLRDDVLGVFGDSEITGKPSGDDLREGKRTVLIALAEAAMPAGAKRIFNEMLGDRSLTGQQIEVMQETLQDTGALEKMEEMISGYVERAMGALHDAPLSPGATAELTRLADVVTKRHA